MRKPWQTGKETLEEIIAQMVGMNKALTESNDTYLEEIKHQRMIIARLGGDIEQEQRRLSELYVVMQGLIHAVDSFKGFVDDMETELWDLLGEEGLEELRRNISVIERIED